MSRLRIREVAEAQGLNITTLHIKVHQVHPGFTVSYPTILGLWHGKTQRPDLDILVAVANALEVPVGELIEADLPPKYKPVPRFSGQTLGRA